MSNSLSAWTLLPRGAAARRLALACACAWTGVAVIALSIVLYVVDATGAYSVAGAAAAGYALAVAFFSVPRSRMVDRFGPRRVFPVLTLLHVTALAGLIAAGRADAPGAVFVALTAVASGSTPPLIGFARGQWAKVVPADELPRAYALTAMLGDIAQIGGAPAAGFLAALVNPAAGLVAAGAFTSLGMVLVLRTVREHEALVENDAPDQPQDQQDGAPQEGVKTHSRSAISFPGLRTLTIGGVGAGLGLGAVDIAVTALSTARGDRWAIGLMLGALGIGGMVGSVVSPRLAQQLSPARRYVAGLGVLVLSTVLLVLTPPGAVVGVLLLVAGFAWGVTNVVLYELLDLVVPSTHSTEAWAWLSTAESLGAAGGAAIAGLVAAHSLPLTFALVSAAVCTGLLTGLLGRRTLVAVEPLPVPEHDTAAI